MIERALVMCSGRGDLIAPIISFDIDESVGEIPVLMNKLTQVFVNIINNSYDEFEQKKLAQPSLSFTVTQNETMQIIRIQDNAGGAPSEILQEVFNPYQSSKGLNGTGLGLYLVQVVVEEQHHGKVFASNQGDGLMIEIQLPCEA
mgnify:CR=1 FL=1